MSSGGGGGGGGDHHGVYHQHGHLARADGAEYVFGNNNDMESFFFNHPASGGVVGGGGSRTGSADELMPPYTSITDYLQGFLDPSGLARHLDAPEDGQVKHELSLDVMSHDSQGTSGAAGEGAAALLTPNSSVSLSSSDREGEGQPRRCKKKADDEVAAEGDEKDLQEDGENSTKAYVLITLLPLIYVFISNSCFGLHLSFSWRVLDLILLLLLLKRTKLFLGLCMYIYPHDMV
jgi:hypothetical protein